MDSPVTETLLSEHEHHAVTCAFCGLACDDLRVRVQGGRVQLLDGAAACRRWFEQASYSEGDQVTGPQMDGRPVERGTAVARAADLLREAELPVIGGLAADVNGIRAALRLAARSGALIDHMHGDAMMRNTEVVQTAGWMTATLTEVRNRADVLIVVGREVFEQFPRLLERVYPQTGALFLEPDRRRELVLIGPWKDGALSDTVAEYRPDVFSIEPQQFPETAAVLRALANGARLQTEQAGGIGLERWAGLAKRLREARYGVIAWSAGDLDIPHAGLAIRSLSELVRDLNAQTRCSALPLAGNQGDTTAAQVALWQTGFPLRSLWRNGEARYDPYLNDVRRRLASGGADALLWLSALTADHPPPPADVPTIAIGHSGMKFIKPPAVFIPVGIPGIDHSGHIYRSDGVVSLPLRRLRESTLPSAAAVLNEICDQLATEDTENIQK